MVALRLVEGQTCNFHYRSRAQRPRSIIFAPASTATTPSVMAMGADMAVMSSTMPPSSGTHCP